MKKLFFFVCVFSSFFFINNVKAISSYTITADYNDSFVYGSDSFLSVEYKDFLDNSLIPYLDEKIGNDYMYVITCFESDFVADFINKTNVYIFPKHYDANVSGNGVFGITTSLNPNSQFNDFSIYARFWDTSYPTNFIGASNWTAYYIMGGLSSSNYQNLIDSWVSNPTWTSSNIFANYQPNSFSWDLNVSSKIVNNNYNYLVDSSYPAGRKFIYYSNEDLKLATSTNESNTFTKFIVNYNNESFEYSLGDSFPTYYSFINSLTKPPVIDNLGNNQYSVNSYNMKIINNNNYQLLCPSDREFQNGFCNVLFSDFNDFNDILNYQFSSYFNFGNKLYLDPDKYFIFTYRLNTGVSLKPIKASFIVNGVSYDFSISSTNFYSNGLNKDIQLVLKTPDSISSQSVVSDIVLTFDNFSNYNYSYNDFRFGVFNVYKFSVVGSTAPTVADLSSDYSNNSLNGISNNSNYSYFSSFVNKYNNHGLSGVVLTPLNMIYRLRNTNPAYCTSLKIPKKIFRINNYEYIEIPCLQQTIKTNFSAPFGNWDNLLSFIQMFLTGIVCYNVARGYLNTIKSIQSPHNNEIEVVDL